MTKIPQWSRKFEDTPRGERKEEGRKGIKSWNTGIKE
jgi:hypothetical protein